MRKASVTLLLTAMLATACEKEITVDLQSKEDLLVVEGIIEDGRFPMVILSRSLNYFSRITPEQLTASFVHNARITVSNGTSTHQLREYKSDTTAGVILYFYTVDTAQLRTLLHIPERRTVSAGSQLGLRRPGGQRHNL